MRGWINVKDRLPDDVGDVIVCCTMQTTKEVCYNKAVITVFFDGNIFFDFVIDEDITKGVTHWMPLPTAPEEE